MRRFLVLWFSTTEISVSPLVDITLFKEKQVIVLRINMTTNQPKYNIIDGKTYSLFVGNNSPAEYYKIIAFVTNEILQQGISADAALRYIRREGNRSAIFRNIFFSAHKNNTSSSFEINRRPLFEYTKATKKHLKNLPFLKFWDQRLSTTERQYHLYMVEIELTNRINSEDFKKCSWKIALLPYCLREFDHDCKASQGDFDMECRNCSKTCFIGRVSKLLRAHGIEPYIWMGSGLKSLKTIAQQRRKKPAVLGVACIPELAAGMRRCHKLGLPAIGIPLNANRCIRWMGEFHENSVYLEKLEKLLD
jgi:hypothetical protein